MIYKLLLNHEPWLYAIVAEMCCIIFFILIDSTQSRQTPPWRCPDLLSVVTFSHDGLLIRRPEGGISLNRIWTGPAITTTQQRSNHQSSEVSLFARRTAQRSWVILRFPTHSAHQAHTSPLCGGFTAGGRMVSRMLGSPVDIQPFITPNIVPPDCNHMSWPCLSWILRLRGLFNELPPLSNGRMHRIFHSGCAAIPIHFQQKIAGSLQCNPDEAG